ncbi:hypothetical protein [Chamaesiphon sp.]|uniref:hypothetical protein n=1 Tax=Chamaesiphon sp. TaxID=2814140 RepID=UPI003593A3AA
MSTKLLVNENLSFHSIQLLTYFSTKQHVMCLQTEAINAASYNDLFSKGLLEFSKGRGLGLYIQTSKSGRESIALEQLAIDLSGKLN